MRQYNNFTDEITKEKRLVDFNQNKVRPIRKRTKNKSYTDWILANNIKIGKNCSEIIQNLPLNRKNTKIRPVYCTKDCTSFKTKYEKHMT